jgi:phosphoribosylformimino-5-aminoimidazole carboxamide ribotide isomerase
VGSFQGPDIIQLTQFCRRYPEKNFIAAGGVRDLADLLQLKAIGIKQVLVASALHSGVINGAMLEQLCS